MLNLRTAILLPSMRRLLPFVPLIFCLLSGPTQGEASDKAGLSRVLTEDAKGIYLTHIPGVFSLHTVMVETGTSYSGTIRDPGGWVHITRASDPRREMVIERLSRDTIRFLVAPTSHNHVVGFSFETSTGCFTLKARELPSGHHPRIHLNGYGPVVKKFPVIFCGNGPHVRVEWQGPFPPLRKTASR
ncbi:MAG: hypothetical protein ACP5OP_07915 [Leptospirillia bacterium]